MCSCRPGAEEQRRAEADGERGDDDEPVDGLELHGPTLQQVGRGGIGAGFDRRGVRNVDEVTLPVSGGGRDPASRVTASWTDPSRRRAVRRCETAGCNWGT